MNDHLKFTEEAERLARKAQEAIRPSEKKMLETHSRFYEALADEPKPAEQDQDAEINSPSETTPHSPPLTGAV